MLTITISDVLKNSTKADAPQVSRLFSKQRLSPPEPDEKIPLAELLGPDSSWEDFHWLLQRVSIPDIVQKWSLDLISAAILRGAGSPPSNAMIEGIRAGASLLKLKELSQNLGGTPEAALIQHYFEFTTSSLNYLHGTVYWFTEATPWSRQAVALRSADIAATAYVRACSDKTEDQAIEEVILWGRARLLEYLEVS